MVDCHVNGYKSPPTTHITHRFNDTARFSPMQDELLRIHMLVVLKLEIDDTLCAL
jgi:hypothetical protein